jgi:hypothetical protein
VTDKHQWRIDVARLPGCGAKIAVLYQQWSDNGQLDEVSNAAADPKLAVLQLFYDIWGVGDATAREFYKKGIYENDVSDSRRDRNETAKT